MCYYVKWCAVQCSVSILSLLKNCPNWNWRCINHKKVVTISNKDTSLVTRQPNLFYRSFDEMKKKAFFPSTAVSCSIQMKASGKQVFLVFGLIIHFMASTTKTKRCIFISRTPKCPGYRSILNKSRRYRLFSALLRPQFGPIWIPSPGGL